jgi:HK97 family phage major capsid protein
MKSAIDELITRRDSLLASLDETADRIAALPSDCPPEERQVLDEIFEKDNAAVQRLTADIRRRETIMKEREKLNPQDDDGPDAGEKLHARVRGSSSEPLTYRKNGPHSFFSDVVRRHFDQAADAVQRLDRHVGEMRVEMRDITTTAGAGGEFVPPLYLQQNWIELLRASRPTADVLPKQDLPPGTMSLTLPKLSGGGAVAVQATQNAGVQETDPTTTSVNAPVVTAAGQIDLSRQLLDRSNPGMDEVLFRDLARAYATTLDVQVLSGAGNSGQALGIRIVSGINAVTYTQATPTAGNLFPKLADAIQRINSAFMNPDTIVMHPRRWGFLLSQVDSTGRPLFAATGATVNAMGSGEAGGTGGQGGVGNVQGIRVILDPNLPTNIGAGTNEDVILVFDSRQMVLYEEGAPRTRVFEDVGSGTLTVRLSLWGYFAFFANRYATAISTVSGTGLVPPTF